MRLITLNKSTRSFQTRGLAKSQPKNRNTRRRLFRCCIAISSFPAPHNQGTPRPEKEDRQVDDSVTLYPSRLTASLGQSASPRPPGVPETVPRRLVGTETIPAGRIAPPTSAEIDLPRNELTIGQMKSKFKIKNRGQRYFCRIGIVCRS